MTSIMIQVTCSLCNMKTDDIKWKQHVVSTLFLQLCKTPKKKLQKSFFEMSYNACPKKSKKMKVTK